MSYEKRYVDDLTRNERYSSELQRRGVNKSFYDANKVLLCPECGRSFNLFYSRAKLCAGCPSLVRGCELARCTHCHTEFPLRNHMSKRATRTTSNYIESIVKRYHDTFGERPGQ
ncbi:hypothetical protein HWN40_05340 [Methanolobus zinderi]|uniref:Uncharacterized protein n=1 Tax=Methanolobus zinderi TaxID=536044 RepID=A0A7D5E698_9EURY|nr:hypothetical protein [Methanolobus zinderi]QLC49713.1 hypothetical protein HWN40_05340 [Methanolobus zinderi]